MRSQTDIRIRNIAVIGAGHWGKNLIRNFSELEVLAAVSDKSSAIRKQQPGRTFMNSIRPSIFSPV